MNEEQTVSERIAKGGSVVFLLTILASPIGYLLRVFYSHTLSIDMFGLFYGSLALFDLFLLYNDLGFGYSVSYLVPKYILKKDYRTCWNLYKYNQVIELVTSIIISIVLIFSADWIGINYFKVPIAKNLIYILCIYFITNSLLTGVNKFFTGLQKEVYYTSMQFCRLFFALIFSLFFWLFDIPTILYFAIAWSVATIVTAIIYNYLLIRNFQFVGKIVDFDKVLFKMMFKFAVPNLLTTSLYAFISSTDIFFLTLFKGVSQTGAYNVILPLATISSTAISPINKFIFPLTSHLAEKGENEINQLLNLVLKIVPFIGFYFGLFIFLFPRAPIILLFGSKWLDLTEIPLKILSLSYVFALLSSFLTTVTVGLGKVKERFYATIFFAILNIVSSMLLIYRFGIMGAVAANSIIYLISLITYLLIIRKTIRFQIPWGFYTRLIIFGFILILITQGGQIRPRDWFQFISFGIIYTILVGFLGFYLNIYDKNLMKALFKTISFKR